MTFNELCDAFLAVRGVSYTEGSKRTVASALRVIASEIGGDVDVRQIDASMCARSCSGGKGSMSTRRTKLTILRSLLNWAVAEGVLDVSPMTNVRMPAATQGRTRFLSAEECRNLLDQCAEVDRLPGRAISDPSSDYCRAMIGVGMFAGLRLDEALALKWQDWDVAGGTLTVNNTPGVFRTKNGRSRVVGVCDQLSHALTSYRDRMTRDVRLARMVVERRFSDKSIAKAERELERVASQAESEWMFPNPDGEKRSRNAIPTQVERLLHGMGPGVSYHVLRHTFASLAGAAGMDLLALQKAMGHSSINVTMRYAHVDRRGIRYGQNISLGVTTE